MNKNKNNSYDDDVTDNKDHPSILHVDELIDIEDRKKE